jgi:hypothetical protein
MIAATGNRAQFAISQRELDRAGLLLLHKVLFAGTAAAVMPSH